MSTYVKRAMITLLPEWEPALDKLKKERFYNDSQAEMLRYVIDRKSTRLNSSHMA